MLVSLVVTLLALIALIVILLIGYLVYVLIAKYYPRPFLLGHSEPLEQFMVGYVKELVEALNAVKGRGVGAVDTLLNTDSKYNGDKLVPTSSDGSANSAPFLYLYFALGDKYKKKPVAGIANRLVPDCMVAEQLSNDTYMEENTAAYEKFQKDWEAIDSGIKSIRGALKANLAARDATKMAELRLLMLIDKKRYIQNIMRMYHFRKSGGLGNMTLLEITLMDYIDYVWVGPKGMVPRVWINFGKNIEEWVGIIRDWITSPSVNDFVMTLPARIGGIKEDFEQHKEGVGDGKPVGSVVEHLFMPPGTKEGDVVEEFGFLKGLLQLPKIFSTIMKFFVTLMEVAQALATAITNPIKALRLIIGLIVGVTIVIVYFVVVTLSFLFYVPAFFIVLGVSIFKTFWWIFLFGIQAAFYIVIWVLDMVTGGLFLKLMRCENLPSKWYTQPGWFFDNKYFRGFMCNYTCATRFVPSDGGSGSWCERLRRGKPHYCPQQILYNAVNAIVGGVESSKAIAGAAEREVLYKFAMPPSYYSKSEVEKKMMIAEYIKDRGQYIKKCYGFDKGYSDFGIAACKFFHSLKNGAAGSQEAKLYEDNKELVDKALKVCIQTHCAEYLKLKGLDISKDCPYCPSGEEKLEKEVDDGSDGKTITQRVIYSMIVMSLLVLGFGALFYYTRDRQFRFLAGV